MSIEKSKDLFWWHVGNIKLCILFSNIFACKLAWTKMNIFFINVWKYCLISSNVFKRRRLKEISVYLQHTVGVRGYTLLWSSLCVGYGKVYNKCTMLLSPSICYRISTHTVYTSRFLLTSYVGLIRCSTSEATGSWSTVEGTLRVCFSYCMHILYSWHNSCSVPLTVLQHAVASAVLGHTRPT